jgi:hypothetical protein
MSEKPFEPSTVTKPIQLLAAWLIGLILINGSFLGAAAAISQPEWAAGFLVICAALNVPVFLAALFLLQTKFRPEMQEDTYYARYLERKSAETQKIEFVEVPTERARQLPFRSQRTKRIPKQTGLSASVQVNDLLPRYSELVEKLVQNGISIYSTFGSTSHKAETPERFVVSVEDGVSIADLQAVLRCLDGFDVDGINISEGMLSDNAIYIGSYIYEAANGRVTPYTDAIKQSLLRDDLTWAKFRSLVHTVED